MKKNLVVVFAALFGLLACSQPKVQQTEDKTPRLLAFLDSCVKANPDAANNEITRSAFSDALKGSFMAYAGGSLHLLDSIPFEFAGMLEYPANPYPDVELEEYKNAGKFLVKFEPPLFSLHLDSLSASLQVFSIVDKNTASALKEKQTYYLSGRFSGFAVDFPLPSERVFTDCPSLVVTSDGLTVSLGTLVYDSLIFRACAIP